MEGKVLVNIGVQRFDRIREQNAFYIDKTDFIRQWWENRDDVTLITRPRRFGKTLNMNMLERFLSLEYAGQGEIFEGLSIWKDEKYHKLQGSMPVIFLSFADVKASTFALAREKICMLIKEVYRRYDFLLTGGSLKEGETELFRKILLTEMTDSEAAYSLKNLSGFLSGYYGKKVIILLDEYDTPLLEAWVYGYWKEMVEFIRGLFNSTFKTNPYLERAIMTGITRISKESIFSEFVTNSEGIDDLRAHQCASSFYLNNLEIITATSNKYAEYFGFTEEEVFTALEEYGLPDKKQQVKEWYDGFTFGNCTDIYNPWSIINYLDKKEIGIYWANSSSNSLVGKLIREGSPEIKMTMEELLRGGIFHTTFDEQIVFNQLDQGDDAVWSLLVASGYLKVIHYEFNVARRRAEYSLQLTNLEIQVMFEQMIERWFGSCRRVNNAFLQALMEDDVKGMNIFMNKVALQTFSYFDTGKNPSEGEPERFYHGFVLGMMVELADRYALTSNRESGFGRYDVMMEPKRQQDNAIIIEFKVQDMDEEELADTVEEALRQIEKKDYQALLIAKGIPEERIRKYGFAFCGKKVLIGNGD